MAFPLARITEPIGSAAPEMPAAVRKEELGCAIAGPRAQKLPAMATESRLGSGQLDPIEDGAVFILPNVPRRMDQFDEAVPLIAKINEHRDREPALIKADRPSERIGGMAAA